MNAFFPCKCFAKVISWHSIPLRLVRSEKCRPGWTKRKTVRSSWKSDVSPCLWFLWISFLSQVFEQFWEHFKAVGPKGFSGLQYILYKNTVEAHTRTIKTHANTPTIQSNLFPSSSCPKKGLNPYIIDTLLAVSTGWIFHLPHWSIPSLHYFYAPTPSTASHPPVTPPSSL